MNRIQSYTDQYNTFTGELLSKLSTQKQSENVVLSPLSIMVLLAIAANSTAGGTKEEVLEALPFDTASEDVIELIASLQKQVTESKALSSANVVYVKKALNNMINPGYENGLRSIFGGELFSSEHIVDDINHWVNEHTKGMIDSIVDESMNYIVACFMNAVAFSSDWLHEYTERDVLDCKFTNADGSLANVPMLHSEEDFYIENTKVKGFIKSYKDEEFSFMALLPKNKKPEFMRKILNSCNFTELLHSSRPATVFVQMPEFEYSFDSNLVPYLKEKGITTLFSDQADFSPLSTETLKADAVIHKAKITVDRKGTKAAAVTFMGLELGALPDMEFEVKSIELNRPFIFAIMHNETGLPIFAGIVNKL